MRRGRVIAVLENADYRARVANAEAQLKDRKAQLMPVMTGSRAEERREAEAALIQAKAVFEEAEAQRRRSGGDAMFCSVAAMLRVVLDEAERESAPSPRRPG